MSYHYSEIEALAAATLGQHLNKKWHVEREGRILASSMRDTIELGHDLQHHILKKGSKLQKSCFRKLGGEENACTIIKISHLDPQ